jgi:hypothetical protein
MSACISNTVCLYVVVFLVTLIVSDAAGQEQTGPTGKKGSYSYYGELKIEDNSFLLDEAFTQEKGVMQFISNFHWSNLGSNGMAYTFTHEIPVVNNHHQVSYTVQYHFSQPFGETRYSGPGDATIGYTYLVAGKDDWMMMVPQINFIIPAGDPVKGLGHGGFGGNLGLALTKRLSSAIVTHYNISHTIIYQADYYMNTAHAENRKAEKNIKIETFAAGVIWYPTSRFNLMFESVANYLNDIQANGSGLRGWQLTSNPGLRFAADLHKALLVAGASFPYTFDVNSKGQAGIFVYLSLEAR